MMNTALLLIGFVVGSTAASLAILWAYTRPWGRKAQQREAQYQAQRQAAESALDLIALERNRQQCECGYVPTHDDVHVAGELALAAVAYASPLDIDPVRGGQSLGIVDFEGNIFPVYPFNGRPEQVYCGERRWLPFEQRIQQLVIAGAFIVAEIQRYQRMGADVR